MYKLNNLPQNTYLETGEQEPWTLVCFGNRKCKTSDAVPENENRAFELKCFCSRYKHMFLGTKRPGEMRHAVKWIFFAVIVYFRKALTCR